MKYTYIQNLQYNIVCTSGLAARQDHVCETRYVLQLQMLRLQPNVTPAAEAATSVTAWLAVRT